MDRWGKNTSTFNSPPAFTVLSPLKQSRSYVGMGQKCWPRKKRRGREKYNKQTEAFDVNYRRTRANTAYVSL